MNGRIGSRVRRAAQGILAGTAFLHGGCASTHQSSLDPSGVQADLINRLWWLYFWVGVLVYALVMMFVLIAVMRRRSVEKDVGDRPAVGSLPEPATSPPAAQERMLAQTVGGAILLTALTLFGLLLGDFLTGRAVHSLQDSEDFVVEITAHQWWWEARYQDPTPSNIFTTANEIHIPVGRTVRFDLSSPDVIHSFWIPNLHGKKDVIPGHPAKIWLRADEEGVYWGQCAEFCGHQHATMRFMVIAEPEEEFEKWLHAQRQPAPEPQTESQKKGQEVFLRTTCVTCHTIQGTPAHGKVGPELTHLASRSRIASNTLPNQRGHLGGWIMDPQSIRPGVRMPLNPLQPDELRALLDYLETLK